jgi:hypothetical protein
MGALDLLLLLLVFYGAWSLGKRLRGPGANPLRGTTPRADAKRVEDLVACRRCGTFVTAAAPACGRPDCPGRRAA